VAKFIAAIVAEPRGPVDARISREVAALAAACPVPAGSIG
jgi:hypothetical protein